MNIEKVFDKTKVRIILKNETPYFNAKDVCDILEITNPSSSIALLDKDDIYTMEVIDTINRKQKMNFVNEGGLYQLIFRSRKENAVKFKRWVSHEVLPSIRKTGKYSIPEEMKKMSVKHRTALTAQWAEKGIKGKQFAMLTVEEYRQLFNDSEIRKKDLSKKEILTLAAFEALETLKLYNNPEIGGFANCKVSLSETASSIKQITE